MSFKSALVSLGLVASTGAFAAFPSLNAATCAGNFGPEGHQWNVKVTLVGGAPILTGRAFAETLRSPNFPSGIRIAPEGFYLLEQRVGRETVYSDAQKRFELRVPDAQPPMGATAGGFLAQLSLYGEKLGTIGCHTRGEREE